MSDTKKSTTRSYSSSKKSTASKKSSSAKKSTSSKNSSAKKNSSKKSTSKKSTSSKKSPSAKKSTSANKAKSASAKKKSAAASKSASIRRTGSSNSWVREILFFIVLAFCVVEFISNFGTGGVVGSVLGTFFFGTFGVIAYIFPFWFFFFAAFWISNYGSDSTVFPKACLKSVAAILLLFFLSVFAHLVYFLKEQMPFREIYAVCAADKVGGGVIGALIGTAFVKGFGLLLSFVLVIIILVIMVVLLRQRAIFAGVTKKSRQEAKEARRQRRLEEQKQKRERERREAERRRRQEAWERDRARQKEEPDYTYLDPQGGQVQGAVAGTGQEQAAGQPRGGTDRTQEFEMPGIYMPGEHDAVDTVQSPDGQEPASAEELPWDEGDAPASAAERVQPEAESAYERVQPEPESVSEEEMSAEAFGEAAAQDSMSADGEDAAGRDGVPADGEDDAGTQQNARQASAVRKKKAASDPLVNAMTAAEIAAGAKAEQQKEKPYVFPRVDLLSKGGSSSGDSRQHLAQMSQKLQMTLTNFGVNAHVTNVTCGPSVTRYEIQPEMGVKVSKIVNLADDIKLNLAVTDIRIEAPIPGKAAIGIEVPNKHNVTVPLRELIESGEFQKAKSKLTFAAGKDIAGKIIVADIAKMPHVLIAGATGSGKSVCINSIIMSVLFKAKPDEVKMIMIDPKVVELSVYNGIPHLLLPVVTDPKKAAGALNWAVSEMTDRYRKFAEYHVRDMQSYNRKVDSVSHYEGDKPEKMPQILIIVDELADLMMAAPGDVEGAICRLAQLARAAGLHLVIATQRPSVNVITGLIKANMPSRIAFAVTSGVDSRTILDMNGAEKLLGKGDMLYYPQNYNKPLRVQGTFVSDAEVTRVVEELIRANGDTEYDTSMEEQVRIAAPAEKTARAADGAKERDVYFEEAGRFVIEKEKGSIGMLQRLLSIGFNRAARIMDQLQEAGVVGPEEGTKARQVLMTAEEFEAFLQNEKS